MERRGRDVGRGDAISTARRASCCDLVSICAMFVVGCCTGWTGLADDWTTLASCKRRCRRGKPASLHSCHLRRYIRQAAEGRQGVLVACVECQGES